MECEENPCKNDGNCTMNITDTICTCLQGYTGNMCEGKVV